MRFVSQFASKSLWMASGFSAILAILTLPNQAKADMSDCSLMCAGLDIMSGEYSACIESCMASGGCPQQTCSTTCGPGIFPQCGTGKCDKEQKCKDAGCACKIIKENNVEKYCQCNGAP